MGEGRGEEGERIVELITNAQVSEGLREVVEGMKKVTGFWGSSLVIVKLSTSNGEVGKGGRQIV